MRRRRWEEAERALNEAIDLSRSMPYPYARAKALYVSGQMRTMQGELGRARDCFKQAQAICQQLGERLYGEAIELCLRDVHGE
jgi:tetratricopeptide (TPR) repeat protein